MGSFFRNLKQIAAQIVEQTLTAQEGSWLASIVQMSLIRGPKKLRIPLNSF